MKFMAIESFFFHGAYREASAAEPVLFSVDKDEVPNARWYPLDEEALEALKKLTKDARAGDDKKGTGPVLQIHGIPEDINVPLRVPHLNRPAPPTDVFGEPNKEPETFSDLQKKLGGTAARPSDAEPSKSK